MRTFPRQITLWVLVAALSACASEDWDNPKDPDSSAYQGPCYGVPPAEKDTCGFWEEFNHGLERWQIGAAPSGVKPIRILAAPADVTVSTVLALPGCPVAGSPGASVEITLPRRASQLSVYWMAAPESEGQLVIGVNGVRQIPNSEDAEGELAGWQRAFTVLDAFAGERVILTLSNGGQEGAACGDEGVRVARVHIRALAQEQ